MDAAPTGRWHEAVIRQGTASARDGRRLFTVGGSGGHGGEAVIVRETVSARPRGLQCRERCLPGHDGVSSSAGVGQGWRDADGCERARTANELAERCGRPRGAGGSAAGRRLLAVGAPSRRGGKAQGHGA